MDPNKVSRVSQEMKTALEAVGFEEMDSPGCFTHPLIYDRAFDFTALSIDGAMQRVFLDGVMIGRDEVQSEVCAALSINR
jgi:hypothetical protein